MSTIKKSRKVIYLPGIPGVMGYNLIYAGKQHIFNNINSIPTITKKKKHDINKIHACKALY
jgi:hypothetical protein